MALPSQVKKIGEQAEALAEQSGIKANSKPLTAVIETSSAVIEPAPATSKVDPDDYKERYSRYKATTDNTIAELRNEVGGLRQEQAANTATIAELRNQVAQKATVTTAPDKSTAGTQDDPAFIKWYGNLAEHIKTDYEKDYLFDQYTIQASMANKPDATSASPDLSALENKIDGVVQYQERTQREMYEDSLDKSFPKDEWITLANGPEWSEFCKQRVSDVDNRTYGQIAQQGDASSNATMTTWVLKQFKQRQNIVDTPADPLAGLVTPEGAGGGSADPIGQINAQTQTFTESQVTQFYVDKSKGKYTDEEYKQIDSQITAAHAAGKVIPG